MLERHLQTDAMMLGLLAPGRRAMYTDKQDSVGEILSVIAIY